MTPTDPTAGLQYLPAPLAFVAGVLVLLVWLSREVRKLLAERNADQTAELEREKARRQQLEADRDTDVAGLQEDINELRTEVARLRDQLTTESRMAHEKHVELIRTNARLLNLLAQHGIGPEESA